MNYKESKNMHNLIALLLLLLFSLLGYTENTTISNIDRLILEYNIIGDYEKGIETVYKDGDKSCITTDTEVNAGTLGWVSYRKKIIITNNYIYDLDLNLKIGKRIPVFYENFKNLSYEEQQDIFRMVLKSIKPLTDTIKKDKGTKSDKTIQYFGKKCDIIETSFFKSYIWNNLLFRREIFLPFKELREIRDLKMNTVIHPSVFYVPDGFSIKDIDENELKKFNKWIQDWSKQREIKKGIE